MTSKLRNHQRELVQRLLRFPWRLDFNGLPQRFAVAGLALAVCTFVRAGDAPLTVLVDSNPVPPLAAPEGSRMTRGVSAAIDLLSSAGPMFNDSKVHGELERRMTSELRRGLEQANKFGQKGVLLKVQVLEQTTEAGTFYSLRGDGATLIGYGQNADAVCFASRCFNSMEAPIPPGARLSAESGYKWFEPGAGGKLKVSWYRKDVIESRAQLVTTDQEVTKRYSDAMVAEAFTGYADQLVKTVRTRQDRDSINQLIASRNDALKKQRSLEDELQRELQHAERAAKTSAMLNQIAGVFSLATTIAMVSTSMGEDVEKSTGGAIKSQADLVQAVKNLEAQTGKRVKEISVQQGEVTDRLNNIRGTLTGYGVKFDMVPQPGTPLKPFPSLP
jgi:hypothetical protein